MSTKDAIYLAGCRREKSDWVGIGHRHRFQAFILLKSGSNQGVSMVRRPRFLAGGALKQPLSLPTLMMRLPPGSDVGVNTALFTRLEGRRAEVTVVQGGRRRGPQARGERRQRWLRFAFVVGVVGKRGRHNQQTSLIDGGLNVVM